MKEIKGNLWNQPDADAICITTNGCRRKDGACVMGRGCALEVKKLYPGIDFVLGTLLEKSGNHVHGMGKHHKLNEKQFILSFPVKHHFRDKADITLIERSSKELVKITDKAGFKKVVIPRMGCGYGRLDWIFVKRIIENILDDRFYVINYG